MNQSQNIAATLSSAGTKLTQKTPFALFQNPPMKMDDIDQELREPSTNSTRPEMIVSAVLHLMSHYSTNSQETGTCIKLASVIQRHLKVMANLPDLAPVLRATCMELSGQWANVVDHAISKPEKRGLMTRLLAGNHD